MVPVILKTFWFEYLSNFLLYLPLENPVEISNFKLKYSFISSLELQFCCVVFELFPAEDNFAAHFKTNEFLNTGLQIVIRSNFIRAMFIFYPCSHEYYRL